MGTENIKEKKMKQTTKIVFICICYLITFIIVSTIINASIQYFYNKGKESAKKEYKIEKEKQQEQILQGMNYNNGEGWYKNCKVKMFYDGRSEKEINKFTSEKDIVDIKVASNKIIIYIEPLLSEDIIIEEE
jgi:uncharacterized membrane-anchored protein YitT (DUF2179 family)